MQNIFLIGPMGSGKTTIGRQLAARLGKVFYDSDLEIEKTTGVDVALIFEIEGEEGFRRRETKIIKELAVIPDSVIATGGGVVLSEDNKICLKENGRIIYLKSSCQKLFDRTRRDSKRPLLNTEDRMATIMNLMETRNPLYEEIADITIATDEAPVREIINNICQQLDIT
ncbi:MAG: shikimate kinase [Planctomycetota bacterium]|jgi:shikimate kinase